jgi:hypothetical protein
LACLFSKLVRVEIVGVFSTPVFPTNAPAATPVGYTDGRARTDGHERTSDVSEPYYDPYDYEIDADPHPW